MALTGKKAGKQGSGRSRVARVLLCALLAMSTVLLLSSCRPTDFFTEVIISPFADTVDEDNPEQTIVNSPDATEESDMLSALDWSSDAEQSSEVQNLATYSEDPTSTLLTHHSHFSLNPRFPGALSSDPVQLSFDKDNTSDAQKATDPTDDGYVAPTQASQSSEEELAEQLQGNVEDADQSGEGSGEGGSSGDEGADSGGAGDGDNGTQAEDSPNGDSYAAYSGDLSGQVYAPGSTMVDPPYEDHMAATGQAAVLVQALGGEGALCAMDANTYYGSGTAWEDCLSSFSSVFADELPSGFEQSAILWRNDGTSSSDVADIDALINACGQDGMIVYDQATGLEDRFNLEQRQRLQAANITLMPIDLTSYKGLSDALYAISRSFSQSSHAGNASDCYSKFEELAGADYQSRNSSSTIYTAVGTEYIGGLTYNDSASIDTSSGLLFERNDERTPLSSWIGQTGVVDRITTEPTATAQGGTADYSVLWAYYYQAAGDGHFSSRGVSGTLSTSPVLLNNNLTENAGKASGGGGVGTETFPYLIVAASHGQSASQVKSSVVSQMQASTSQGLAAYSVTGVSGLNNEPYFASLVGQRENSGAGNSILDSGASPNDIVRQNPTGLLGEWTEGSLESVLEGAWAARIYSASPSGVGYTPICNYSAGDLRSTVLDFYQTFYRYDASGMYGQIVTDEGL